MVTAGECTGKVIATGINQGEWMYEVKNGQTIVRKHEHELTAAVRLTG